MKISTVTLPGLDTIHYIVDESRDKVIAAYLLRNGIWEPLETVIMQQIIKKDYRVIDIGANMGYYSILFSKLVGDTGTVHAFEPEPANMRLLSANLLINNCSNITPVQKAVSSKNNIEKLYLSTDNLGDHRLFVSDARPSCEVETVSLDEFFPNDCFDFIKIDTQGAEPRIFAGMSNIVERSRTKLGCLVEFSPGLLSLTKPGLDEYLSELERLQARVHWIDQQGEKIVLHQLSSPSDDLRAIANSMLSSGIPDLSRDIVIFFSEEAEYRHLRPPEK